ncbi:MAG: energy-coupling factor ABC transporter ATP-binding protein [Leucobacter sp.]
MIHLREAGVVVSDPDGDRTILQPTSLEFREHRIALIGANGSGKSTLARLLNGLVEPSTGSVQVAQGAAAAGGSPDGLRAEAETAAPAGQRWLDTRRDGAAVRRLVGFVFTNPAAQLVMPTVIEDVALSLRRLHRGKADRLAAARAALDRFGLGELADRSVHTLSGGQQQLLAIASVLATDPAILIADEPTTLLDLRNSRLVTETLLGLPQQLIVATHDLELAAGCERVLVVESGAVAFDTAAAGADPAEAVDWYRAAAR